MYVKKYFWLVVLNIDYVQPYFFGMMIQIDNNNIVGMGWILRNQQSDSEQLHHPFMDECISASQMYHDPF